MVAEVGQIILKTQEQMVDLVVEVLTVHQEQLDQVILHQFLQRKAQMVDQVTQQLHLVGVLLAVVAVLLLVNQHKVILEAMAVTVVVYLMLLVVMVYLVVDLDFMLAVEVQVPETQHQIDDRVVKVAVLVVK